MKKCEIVFPYDLWSERSSEYKKIIEEHCRFYMFAHHHVFEPESTFEHVHVGMWLRSDNTPDVISRWFGLKPNSIQKIKSQETAYALYIGLHYGQTDKEPLTADTSEFFHSLGKSLDEFCKVADEHIETERILDDIASGIIKEYEVAKLPVSWQRKHDRDIASALKVASRKSKGVNMDVEKVVIWLYGNAGTGKTSLAKHLALNDNSAFYIASDSNPLDDYQGQPVLILDDISTGTLTSKALLKLIDPYNNSSQGARYYNKMVCAKLIIITSSVSPSTWWNEVHNGKTDGNIHQLFRRLNGGIYRLTNDRKMYFTMYDPDGVNCTNMTIDIPPEVLEQLNSDSNTLEARASSVLQRFNFTAHIDDDDSLPFE